MNLAQITSEQRRWPALVLSLALAYFLGCPVLNYLAATFILDGESFVLNVGASCAILLVMGLAGLRLGFPLASLAQLRGPTLALTIIVAAFWLHWVALNVLSPSPEEKMRYQMVEALLRIVIPLAIFLCWRSWISTTLVIRFMVMLCAVFCAGLAVRWVLGLGFYHAGRWNAGNSLESLRCARYCCLAFWVFALACMCPPEIVPLRYKIIALVSVPVAIFMMVASNSRGPWLALGLTLVVTAIPLARRILGMIGRDVRLLFLLALLVLAVAGVMAWKLSEVESDFGRLTTLTNDGGSAQERVLLWHDHWHMISQSPWTFIAGCGYSHGLFYPHNMFLEALVDGGVVCLALLSGMVILGLYVWFVRAPAWDTPCLLFAGMFFNCLFGDQVSGSLGTGMTWFGPLIMVMRLDELERPGLSATGEDACLAPS